MYGLGVQGPVSDNLQINLAYAQLDIDKNESPGYDPYNGNTPLVNTFGSHGLVLSAMWNPMKISHLLVIMCLQMLKKNV